MNRSLITNWNNTVSKNDIVFHLGDFCWGSPTKWRTILDQLNGHIYLIKGNHDDHNLKDNIYPLFDYVSYQMKIHIDGWSIYLNHYPFLCFGGAWHPETLTAQLFGHVHSYPGSKSLDCSRLINLFPNQYDVGVDNNNFTPISWNEVKLIIEKQINNGINK